MVGGRSPWGEGVAWHEGGGEKEMKEKMGSTTLVGLVS